MRNSTFSKFVRWLDTVNWNINNFVYRPEFIVAVAFICVMIFTSIIFYQWGKTDGVGEVPKGESVVEFTKYPVVKDEPFPDFTGAKEKEFICDVDNEGLPIGYKVVENGIEWSFMQPDGNIWWMGDPTRQRAIDHAKRICDVQKKEAWIENYDTDKTEWRIRE